MYDHRISIFGDMFAIFLEYVTVIYSMSIDRADSPWIGDRFTEQGPRAQGLLNERTGVCRGRLPGRRPDAAPDTGAPETYSIAGCAAVRTACAAGWWLRQRTCSWQLAAGSTSSGGQLGDCGPHVWMRPGAVPTATPFCRRWHVGRGQGRHSFATMATAAACRGRSMPDRRVGPWFSHITALQGHAANATLSARIDALGVPEDGQQGEAQPATGWLDGADAASTRQLGLNAQRWLQYELREFLAQRQNGLGDEAVVLPAGAHLADDAVAVSDCDMVILHGPALDDPSIWTGRDGFLSHLRGLPYVHEPRRVAFGEVDNMQCVVIMPLASAIYAGETEGRGVYVRIDVGRLRAVDSLTSAAQRAGLAKLLAYLGGEAGRAWPQLLELPQLADKASVRRLHRCIVAPFVLQLPSVAGPVQSQSCADHCALVLQPVLQPAPACSHCS